MTNLSAVLDAVDQWFSGDFCKLADTVFRQPSESGKQQCDYCSETPSTSSSVCGVFRTAHMMEAPSTSTTAGEVKPTGQKCLESLRKAIFCCCPQSQTEPSTVQVYPAPQPVRRPATPGVALVREQSTEEQEQGVQSSSHASRGGRRTTSAVEPAPETEEIEMKPLGHSSRATSRTAPTEQPVTENREHREVRPSGASRSHRRIAPAQENVLKKEEQETKPSSHVSPASRRVAPAEDTVPERREREPRPTANRSRGARHHIPTDVEREVEQHPHTSNDQPDSQNHASRSEYQEVNHPETSSPPPLRELKEEEMEIIDDISPPTQQEIRQNAFRRQEAFQEDSSRGSSSDRPSTSGISREAKAYFCDSDETSNYGSPSYYAQFGSTDMAEPVDSNESQNWLELLEDDYSENNPFNQFVF
uniref:Phlebovirus_G2 domain-containing protein n=1 Tax=Caenorhabditis tropicalis TaxID=1561998 RepID=A0A1I7UW33_9PELO